MKKIYVFLLVAFAMLSQPLFGQLEHGSEIMAVDGRYYQLFTIEKGATITSLAKKYNLSQQELIAANPQLVNGPKNGEKIKIPVVIINDMNHQSFLHPEKGPITFRVHVAGNGEGMYRISKQYEVPIDELLKYNPTAENGIKDQQRIKIPIRIGLPVRTSEPDNKISTNEYQVKPGETFYSVSKLFGISADELKAFNQITDDKLPAGTILKIPSKSQPVEKPQPEIRHLKTPYARYVVKKGDNFSSLRRRFGVSKNELIELNPDLQEGLKTDIEIALPLTKKTKAENLEIVYPQNEKHVVAKGETLFGIAAARGLTPEDIKAENPGLESRGLIIGDTLILPGKKSPQEVAENNKIIAPEDQKPATLIPEDLPTTAPSPAIKRHSADTFRIAMLMPFYLNKNKELNTTNEKLNEDTEPEDQSGTVIPDTIGYGGNSSSQIFSQSKSALNFYEGFLLALDTLQKSGTNIKMKIYDTEQQINTILNDHWLLDVNLIVGPRDVKTQPVVSAFSAKNHIPMVAPFISADSSTNKNPWFFQHTPSKQTIALQTARFVAHQYAGQNVVVLTTGDFKKTGEWAMILRLKELLTDEGHIKKGGHYTEVPFTGGGDQGHIQARSAMREGVENVVLVPLTENKQAREATLARVVNALQVLSKSFSITLIGMSDYPRFESINTEFFHRLNLHYLTPSFIDYTKDQVKQFVRKYRVDFKGEPDQYSFRGYDIGLFFGEAFRLNGKDLEKNVQSVQANQLQDQFRFKKAGSLSGFQNQSLFIVNFCRDWEVRKSGEIIGDKVFMSPQANQEKQD